MKPYLFVSYAREDFEIVSKVISLLKEQGINTWSDELLQPGQNWEVKIFEALSNAAGLLVFVSEKSLSSNWIRKELSEALKNQEKLIIPVVIDSTANVPEELRQFQWLDISEVKNKKELRDYTVRIAHTIEKNFNERSKSYPGFSDSRRAQEMADELRNQFHSHEPEGDPPQSVFIVHGHDENLLREVESFISSKDIKPVVLKRVLGPEESLFQKFKREGMEAKFAIVLVSPDDYGCSKYELHEQAEKLGIGKLARLFLVWAIGYPQFKFRARQNVIFELGFFYGSLSFENVFLLERKAKGIRPHFERPSDLGGVVWDQVDESGDWKESLSERLRNAGFLT